MLLTPNFKYTEYYKPYLQHIIYHTHTNIVLNPILIISINIK